MKKVEETEAIRVYVQKDNTYGCMWRLEPPYSCRKEFEDAYPSGCWAKTEKELCSAVKKITDFKLCSAVKKITDFT